MKMKQTASKAIEMQKLERRAAEHRLNFDDVIRMKFLEQSARYLGVYVENNVDSLMDERSLN